VVDRSCSAWGGLLGLLDGVFKITVTSKGASAQGRQTVARGPGLIMGLGRTRDLSRRPVLR